jgi:hypothetical protein
MAEISLTHFLTPHTLILVFILVLLIWGRRTTPRGGPPTHPIPVTSPLENSRFAKNIKKESMWQALTGFLRS